MNIDKNVKQSINIETLSAQPKVDLTFNLQELKKKNRFEDCKWQTTSKRK